MLHRSISALCAAASLCALVGLACGVGVQAIAAATGHDFAAGSYNLDAGATSCQPCHAPHHAITEDSLSSQLWSHALSSAAYGRHGDIGGSYTAGTDGDEGMDRASRLCLGCHDGAVALDAFGTSAGGSPAGSTPQSPGSIVDLECDHPIGIGGAFLTPQGSPVSSSLKTATVSFNRAGVSTSGIKNVSVPAYNSAGRALRLAVMSGGSRAGTAVVGCTTCHDPHAGGPAESSPHPHMLNADPGYLCKSCHVR